MQKGDSFFYGTDFLYGLVLRVVVLLLDAVEEFGHDGEVLRVVGDQPDFWFVDAFGNLFILQVLDREEFPYNFCVF